jgi:hypothetical protein
VCQLDFSAAGRIGASPAPGRHAGPGNLRFTGLPAYAGAEAMKDGRSELRPPLHELVVGRPAAEVRNRFTLLLRDGASEPPTSGISTVSPV